MLEQKVYREDIDAICHIDGQRWLITEAIVNIDRNNEADFVDFIAVPSRQTRQNFPDDVQQPVSNDGLLGADFTLDVKNDIRTSSSSRTRLFTGKLANLSTSVKGAWEGIAFDQTFATFEQGSSLMSREIDFSASVRNVRGAPTQGDISTASYIKATELLDDIIEQSGLDKDKTDIHMSDDGLPQGGEDTRNGGIDTLVVFSSTKMKVADIFDRLKKSTNSEWWMDRNGVFHFGAVNENTVIDAFELQFVKDSSAGLTTPPYNSVQVIGSGVVSEDGWDKSALNEETALTISENIDDDEQDTDKLKEPIFTYKNMQIQTQEEADNVRQKIIDNLQKQTKDGKITVVGFPEVRPLDVVKMPNNDVQPFGGGEYGVHKVVHKIGAGDGFVTDIHVEGLDSTTFGLLASVEKNKYPFLESSQQEIIDSVSSAGLDSVGVQ